MRILNIDEVSLISGGIDSSSSVIANSSSFVGRFSGRPTVIGDGSSPESRNLLNDNLTSFQQNSPLDDGIDYIRFFNL